MIRLFFLLLIPFVARAQADSTDIIVKDFMNRQKIAGLSLAVVKNGKAVTNKGYGMANLEWNLPVTPNTVIRLGSVSKQFFSTAILTLVEAGKIRLTDSVHRFFPDAPESWRPITITHLLSHSSGLQREGPAYDNFNIQPDINIIRSAYKLPLLFKPGEKFLYCNLGYFMLADIISQVSGMPWQDYIQQKIFLPAGMTQSYYTDFYEVIPNRASGYMQEKGKFINATAMLAVRPSGGFLSTSSDMIKWERAMREKKIILKSSNWEKLWQRHVKVSDNPASKEYYGFGWIIEDYKGHELVQHNGANTGFRSVFLHFIKDGLSVIILTNTEEANPRVIANALADYYFRKK